MNPIQLIFNLLMKFVPMDTAAYAKALEEGNMWYSSIRIDDEANDKPSHPILIKAKKFFSQWYGVVLCAVLYLILTSEIQKFLNPDINKKKDSEDDF